MPAYIKTDTYLFTYVQFIFSFYPEIAFSFVLCSFVFSILKIAYFKLPCKMGYIIKFSFL